MRKLGYLVNRVGPALGSKLTNPANQVTNAFAIRLRAGFLATCRLGYRGYAPAKTPAVDENLINP